MTVDDVVRWKDHLIASGKVSAKTINEGRLAALSSVLGWGKDNRKLTINAALGIRVRAKKKPRTREKDLREEEAKIILRASLKAGSLEEQLARRHKAARRWIPWLCCYSGARVTEIAQLRGSDVQQEEGHWFMLLSPEAGSIKSDEFRRVPLHPHIIEQGFIEFVRAAGKGPLFYDPKRARAGKADKPQANTVGHKLAEWVREIGVDDPQVAPNHGWRHRFIVLEELGEASNVPPIRLDGIRPHPNLPVLRGSLCGNPRIKLLISNDILSQGTTFERLRDRGLRERAEGDQEGTAREP